MGLSERCVQNYTYVFFLFLSYLQNLGGNDLLNIVQWVESTITYAWRPGAAWPYHMCIKLYLEQMSKTSRANHLEKSRTLSLLYSRKWKIMASVGPCINDRDLKKKELTN